MGCGRHYGGDPLMRAMLFDPSRADPLGQRAGSRAGAMSVFTGVRRIGVSSAERR